MMREPICLNYVTIIEQIQTLKCSVEQTDILRITKTLSSPGLGKFKRFETFSAIWNKLPQQRQLQQQHNKKQHKRE